MRRLLLFDWIEGGHHVGYLRSAARALRSDVDVAIAAPESARGRLEREAEFISLGEARPAPGDDGLAPVLTAERDALFGAIRRAHVTHALHMFADELVPLLARERRRAPACVSVLVFRKASHYPLRFRSHLFGFELRRELGFDAWLAVWRQRPDAGAALLLDEYAVALAGRWPGAPVVWLPEPPVEVPEGIARDQNERRGIALTGALDWRKGIHRLADALAMAPTDARVTIAGQPVAGYEETLAELVARMRDAGAEVDLRDRWIEPEENLAILGGARVLAAPYPRHRGMSRLILEAAAVGTPIVADRYGLLGRLVREHSLGAVADCDRPLEFRRALEAILSGRSTADPEALRRFAARYNEDRFRQALLTTITRR